MRAVVHYFRTRIVAPFRDGTIPHGHLSRGVGFGLGLALLPIVGQLYVTPTVWAVFRPMERLRFNLPVALGMVCAVNPPLKVPLFYVYLLSGEALLASAGFSTQTGAHEFKAAWDAATDAPWIERFGAAGHLLSLALERYALPLGVGGIAWAVLFGGMAGVGTAWVLARRRKRANTQSA